MSNDLAADIIRRFEGLRLDAYQCPAGEWTIGYGHTRGVQPGDRITTQEAERLLLADLQEFADAVDRLVKVPLAPEQRAALISFAYNCGVGALERSTLLRRLNAGDYDAVPVELARWNKAGGKVLAGLIRRRAAEADLWRSASAAPAPASPPRGGLLAAILDFILGLLRRLK